MSKFYERLYEKQELDKVILDFMKVETAIGPAPPALDGVGAPTAGPTTADYLAKFKKPASLDKTGPWSK